MNWVKLQAYEDGVFALNEILKRFEFDVSEANQLPVRIREGRTYRVHRDGDHSATIRRESKNGKITLLTLSVEPGNPVHIRAGQETIPAPIRAVPNEETGEVNWSLDDADPIPLWKLSRNFLRRYVFEF